VSEHISRKELKQDKIKETFEHGAEAVYSHSQTTLLIVLALLVAAAGYGGWRFYSDRQDSAAQQALDLGMKAYSGRVGPAVDPNTDPNEVSYTDETARSQDALAKFTAAAGKYPNTKPGKRARYYAVLCLEDLDKQNQALEELKKLTSDSDAEIAAQAQYQTAVLYHRTGKTEEAIKLFRALADKHSVFVPRPLVLLELAAALKQSNPKEAATVYQQVKKEYPNSALSEEADRGLDLISPKS